MGDPEIVQDPAAAATPDAAAPVAPGAAPAAPAVPAAAPVAPGAVPATAGSTQVFIPHVIGLTQAAAAAVLKSAGLIVGAISTAPSALIPANGVSATDPAEATPVNQGSAINLEISTGPKRDWTQFIPGALFTLLGLVVLGVIVYGVTLSSGSFLKLLSDTETARGLITFLITVATVGIALILAISTVVLSEGEGGDKRFDRGKQVLSVLIGVLGTIVGFYFGSAVQTKNPQPQTNVVGQNSPLTITTTSLPEGVVGTDYSTTLTSNGKSGHLTWSVTPKLPTGFSFDAASGTISGKPSGPLAATAFSFTVTDDASPPTSSSPARLTLQVNNAPGSQH